MSLALRVLHGAFANCALLFGRACRQSVSNLLSGGSVPDTAATVSLGRRDYDRSDAIAMRPAAPPADADVIVINGFDPAEDALMAEVETAEDVDVLGQSVLDDGVLISFDNGLRAFLPGLTEPVPERSILIASRCVQPESAAIVVPQNIASDVGARAVADFDEAEDVLIVDPIGSADVTVSRQTVTDAGLIVELSSGGVICLEGLSAPIDSALIMTRPPRKRAAA